MADPAKLFQAIESNDVAAVTAILEAEPILAAARGANAVSAVMYAIYRGQNEIATSLARIHPALDIFEAAAIGDTARASELLKHDASAIHDWSPDGGTALHFACFFRQPKVVELLIRAGADVNLPAKGFGSVTPLHAAAAGRNPEAIEQLLAAGAKPNVRQQGGYTPLHSSANNGDARSVRLLIDHGADPTLRSDDGKTAADLATKQGHNGILPMLAQGKAAAG